jgi:hypothetical protein
VVFEEVEWRAIYRVNDGDPWWHGTTGLDVGRQGGVFMSDVDDRLGKDYIDLCLEDCLVVQR